MTTADIFEKFLRYALIATFLGYYVLGWVLTARLAKCSVRTRILRWAFMPAVIVGAMCISCQLAKCTRGPNSASALIATLVIFFLGAILFSIWLERLGGRELLYVPIAFARFGNDGRNSVTRAVTELSSGKPDFKRDLILSLLPALFAILTIIFLIWETSRPLGP